MKVIRTTISSMLVILIFMFACNGCSIAESNNDLIKGDIIVEFNKLTILEVSFNPDEGKHAREYATWSANERRKEKEAGEKSAPQSFTVEFNGVNYTGEFGYASKIVPFNYITYNYSCTGKFSFEIKAKTKELTGFSFIERPDPGETLDETKCREIADEFASKYIDISKYKVDSEINIENNNCTFSYDRVVSGLATSEGLFVTVDGNGNIVYFYTRMLHDFDNVVAVEYDENKIFDAIDAKIAKIYKGVDNYERYTVLDNYCLVKLEDGRFAIMYNLVCEFEKVFTETGYSIPATPVRILVTGDTVRPATP